VGEHEKKKAMNHHQLRGLTGGEEAEGQNGGEGEDEPNLLVSGLATLLLLLMMMMIMMIMNCGVASGEFGIFFFTP
jgi:hypothetical protein